MTPYIENFKDYVQKLHETAPQNIMIPMIVGVLGIIILLRNRIIS